MHINIRFLLFKFKRILYNNNAKQIQKKNYKIDIHMTKFSSSHLRELALLAQWVEHFVMKRSQVQTL